LEEALERAADSGFARRAAIGSSNHIYSFIPAKAGAGASTLATNTAVALAARNPRDTLLMDFDWSSGVIGLSLNLAPSSLSPAAGREETAESLWLSRILRHGHLDVFPNTPEAALELLRNYRARNLLRMARNHYKTSIIDLAGEYDEDAYAVLKQSHMIFLVTTPELPSLRLAHERIALLTAEGLGHRVELIVNRSGPVHREQIEDLLGFPVYFEFPNHYRAVNTALQHGLPVGAMGLHFARFAALISGDPAGREEPPAGSWLPWAEMREELTKAFGRRYS
jgi:pilus assembly protein CpaE